MADVQVRDAPMEPFTHKGINTLIMDAVKNVELSQSKQSLNDRSEHEFTEE